MTETEKFLTAFRKLESALNNVEPPFQSVLDYENSLSDRDLSDRLKTCRIIRNYVSHHSDGARLFPASPAMTKFLTRLAESIEAQGETVGKLARKAYLVTGKTTVKELADGFSVQKGTDLYLPYAEDGELPSSVIPLRVLCSMLSMDLTPAKLLRQKVSDFTWKKEKAELVEANTPAKDYAAWNRRRPILVVSKRHFRGIVQPGRIAD